MRRYTRDQVKNLMSTIRSGLKFAVSPSIEDAITALSDCHVIAQVAEKVLLADVDSVRAVHYRRLMRGLMKLIEEAIKNVPKRGLLREHIKFIREHINLIENELDAEAAIRMEIVFMPMFAKEWHAMDSIWRAAKQDSRCECVVMPAPYYQRTVEGRLGRRMCEINLFPKYLNAIHFEKYDIAKRKPDAVYIQNVDDASNELTVVKESFFTRELKRNTGKLIYVPPKLISNIEDYGEMPLGINNTDIIIAQSEEAKKLYPQSQQVLALGSPLLDKVVEYREERPRLPQQWEDILGNRRIVLLNTNPDVLMLYEMSYIEKIEKIIGIFEKRRDIALIWRPEQISKRIPKELSSNVLRSYRKLISAYKESGIGVFDDTSDFRATITIADAFLGDYSDKMPFLGLAGKPMMIQNVDLYMAPPSEITTENAYSYISDDALSYVFHESPAMDISEFLDFVIRCDGRPNEGQVKAYKKLVLNSDGGCGEAIHNTVTELCVKQ